ncbi:HAD family hydrolase [Pseudoalteromonas gelatinilytica]|uniref:HAD family hydrolase n=1 Tax=Pseudoalteromonas gelatinilytica TaxID=1703256 RepID=UPI0007C4C4B9|nr:HAD hydrolase-like protein [Pseudoalteromonas gelatinilytica]
MTKQLKSVLITDIDNTLFDWFSIWFATFNPLLEKTSEITGVSKDILKAEIRTIHQKHGTAEYAFVLEELPSLQAIYKDKDELLRTLNPAIHASRSNRLSHLKLYKGVYDTLSELRSKRVKVIAYTESKEWYTKFRLKRLGLEYFIDTVYSPGDHKKLPISDDCRTPIVFENTKFKQTPEGELKPNPKILLEIIKEIGADVSQCVYIGDSEIKDIDMAYDANVTSVYAKYGNIHFEDRKSDYDLLREVTHWTDEDVEREKQIKENAQKHNADYEVNNFCEILELFEFERFTGK